jgi:hypothetical protein
MSINEKRGFLICLKALIVCIGSGRTALLHGRGSIQVMLRVARSYLRLLLAKIYGFSILFLVWQGLITISTSSSDPLYLVGLRMAMPYQWVLRLWDIHTPRVIT